MKMDLNAIIEKMETGDQDAALTALQAYNKEKSQCFTFNSEEQEDRERLGELVLGFLERDLQPSCQLACLETIRILSRDKFSLAPFVTQPAILTLSRHAGIAPGDGATPEIPDLDVTVEALKCLCNIVFNSAAAQEAGAQLGLMGGLAERLKQCHERQWSHEVRFFDLRLTFLLTALRLDVRTQLAQELRGVSLLANALDATLGLRWLNTYEVVRADAQEEGEPLAPLGRQETERAMEILKILFNVTFDTNRRKVDEEEAATYRHLGAILRHCLMSSAEGEDRTEEFHSHTVNLLGNLPLPCLDVLLIPKGNKLKETLLPSLNLLTESARIHRETRKFLRTKYTGYGNAAGLLAARGLMRGGRDPGLYSEDEDSDTEEYREAKPHINPVTGRVEDEQPNPMEGMTEEQKEYEAMKLVNMFDKLSRDHVIQPMKLGADGKMTSLEPGDFEALVQQGQRGQREQNSDDEQEIE
ncbi:hypothetical protein JZ751_008140 [Albula glossodonta]|uniref:Synembryn n=1 Tax=Albula glossodonta TaxID=121402 RepID=A0A8T2N707_9TELE|nr:hypothetical protein JZ751_008140 [Albula glossodonta]